MRIAIVRLIPCLLVAAGAILLAACTTAPALPLNADIDTGNHLLASTNYRSEETTRTLLIVTGIPEGPGRIADSMGSTLEDFFSQPDRQTACGQIYAPTPAGSWAGYRRYLEHALLASHAPVDLVVYSAGAMGLMDLPREAWTRIRSLTFASPMLGANVLPKGFGAVIAAILFPSTDRYMRSIAGLLDYLLAEGAPVNVSLGGRDTVLDNAQIAARFSQYDPGGTRIRIETIDRPHGMTALDVQRLFEPST
jgi:hypothetical protein